MTGPTPEAVPGTEPRAPLAVPRARAESRRDPASFRDPSGFVYWRDGRPFRQINPAYSADWESFLASGLHARLLERGVILGHEDAPLEMAYDANAWRVVAPEPLDFVSYPYEWTFGQLRDAALVTLDAQAQALDAGLTLKDASAYNVQFHRGRAVLVDALSFERAEEGAPWVAYRQFCEHFLGPLALMAYRDVRLGLLLRDFIDGVRLDLTSRLLPTRTWFRLGLAAHLHLHARAQRRYQDRPAAAGSASLSRNRLVALIASLRSAVEKLRWRPTGTEWVDYAGHTSYSGAAEAAKKRLVEQFLVDAGGNRVWDLGANVGVYSRIAAQLGRSVIAFDVDPAAAELHYRALRADGVQNVLPLVLDLANPSPGLGWAHSERRSLRERANADVVLALALLHHLAIGGNVPLPMVSGFMATLAPRLVIEFVPKDDPMVRRLLATRRDVFADYSLEGFRAAFSADFEVVAEVPLEDSPRVLFHLRRR